MIFEHRDYRSYLRAIFAERKGRNSSYSLRAYAKAIGLSPTAVSQLLRGGSGLSTKRALGVADRLGLSSQEAEYLTLLVEWESTESSERKSRLQERMNALSPSIQAHDLTIDHFQAISDWYHFAILEMLQVESIPFEPKAIAQYLEISTIEAEAAIERLERLELIEILTPGEKPRRTVNRLLVASNAPSEAIRKYNRQILAKAIESLESQSPQEKVIGTETFAFDQAGLAQARALTDQYLNAMLELAKSIQGRRDLYQLCVQFFRLNGLRKEKS